MEGNLREPFGAKVERDSNLREGLRLADFRFTVLTICRRLGLSAPGQLA